MSKVTQSRGTAGLYRRALVPASGRAKAIKRILGIPDEKRSPDHWWELGETIVLNGLLKQDESMVQEGIRYLKRASEMDPPSIAALMDLGWLLMYRHMELFALEYLEKAASLTTKSRDLYALLAICNARLGNRDSALSAIKRATLSPGVAAIDFDLQRALEDNESDSFIEKAKGVQFLKISPEEAHAAGFPIEEIYEIVRMVNSMSLGGDDSIEAIESLAQVDYSANDYNATRARLERIIRSEEATAKSYVMLGLMAFKEGDEDQALALYEKALSLDGENYLANVNYTHIKATRFEYSEEIVQRMIWAVQNQDESNPRTSAAACTNLGNYFSINGQYDEDIDLQTKALQLYCDDESVAPINLFATLLAVGNLNKAASVLEKYRKNFKNKGFYNLAKPLLKTFKGMAKDPILGLDMGFKILNDEIPLFNRHSLIPLVSRTLKSAKVVPQEYREEFYTSLGYLANAVNCQEISAECWRRLGSVTGDQAYFMNYAMDLSLIGKSEQALRVLDDVSESVKSVNERTCSMSAVIYMQAGDSKSAKVILEKGFEHNPEFSLLYSSYIVLAEEPVMAGQKEAMLKFAASKIPLHTENPNLQYHLARIKSSQGKISEAADLITSCFFEDGVSLSSLQMRSKDAHRDETDVKDLFDVLVYKKASQILYRAGRLGECAAILKTMQGDHSLADGDSLVGLQTIARRSPDLTPDYEVLVGMGDQVPVLIERAICMVEQQDIASVQIILDQLDQMYMDGIDISDFNHLEGKPLALIEAIRAQCKHATGHSNVALECLQKAIKIDDQAPYIYETFIDIGFKDDPTLAFKIVPLVEKRLKGSPWIRLRELSAAIEVSDYAKASEVIKDHKLLITKLMPAGRYQSYLEATLMGADIPSKQGPDWISHLSDPHKAWLLKAYQLLCAKHEEAAVIYLMKWFEDIANSWFCDFKAKFQADCRFTRETPFSAFIDGQRDKMNMGAMVKSLSVGIRSSSTSSPEYLLITYFKKQSSGMRKLLGLEGVHRLRRVGDLRNCLMHTTPVNPDDVQEIRRWLMSDTGDLGEIASVFYQKP